MSDEDEPRFARTLEVYRHAKRETLRNDGPAPLRRELAKLTRSLDAGEDPYLEHTEVDEEFRRAKARVLQELLREADARDEA